MKFTNTGALTRLASGASLVFVGVLSGCNSAGSAGTGKQLKLAFVTNNASDYWTVARKGVEKADAELDNVSVEVQLPGQGTAAEQTQLINDLLAKGTDGLAISPVDPANQTNFLNKIASQTVMGAVILIGVLADQLLKNRTPRVAKAPIGAVTSIPNLAQS